MPSRIQRPGVSVLRPYTGEPVGVRLSPYSTKLAGINSARFQIHHRGAREVVSKPTKRAEQELSERIGYAVGFLRTGARRSPGSVRLKRPSLICYRAFLSFLSCFYHLGGV